MSDIEVVESSARGVVVSASGDLTHLCPYRDEVDKGTVTVSWRVGTRTVELHSWAEFLRTFAEERCSHEDVTTALYGALRGLDGLEVLTVETWWETAGLSVSVASRVR